MLAKWNRYVRPQSLLRAFLVGLWCCCCSLIPKLHTIYGWILFAAYKTYDSITIYLRDSFDCALCIASSSNCSTDTNKSSLGFCEARKYYLRPSVQESEAEEEFWVTWSHQQPGVVTERAWKTLNRNKTGREKGRGGLGSGFSMCERLEWEQCESLLLKQLPYLDLRSYRARLRSIGCDGPCYRKVLSKIGKAQLGRVEKGSWMAKLDCGAKEQK